MTRPLMKLVILAQSGMITTLKIAETTTKRISRRASSVARAAAVMFCGPFDLDEAFYGTKCESTSCGVSICNTDAAPARRISVAAAVAALVSALIA